MRLPKASRVGILALASVALLGAAAHGRASAGLAAAKPACPLEDVKLPGTQYVGKPVIRVEGTGPFSLADVLRIAGDFYGGVNVCFGVSSDGKRLLGYAFPAFFACPGGSVEVQFVEKRPRMVKIRKGGAFSAGVGAKSYFKGTILAGGKAAGTLREKREVKGELCDTGIVRWTARRAAR